MNCLIVGCGYLGQHVARLWNAQGERVFAITRSQTKADQLGKQSIEPIVFDWYQRGPGLQLPKLDRVLISVSHAPVSNMPSEETHVSGLKNLFDRLDGLPSRLAYLSTTGVYATCDDGRWIDENSPVSPNRPGSIAALAAEQWIVEHFPANQFAILRAAGIYGPKRIPRLDKLRAGELIEADPDSYLNLIHVEDLAHIAIALMYDQSARGVFNVSDGQPILRRDYYRFIAQSISAIMPMFREQANVTVGSESTSQRARGEGTNG